MARAKKAKPGASDQAAGKHFDELDALMERMLALPVEPASAETPTIERPVFPDFQFEHPELADLGQAGGKNALAESPLPVSPVLAAQVLDEMGAQASGQATDQPAERLPGP